MLLALYRAATTLGAPLIDAHLRRRVRLAKEDPARIGERWGRPSAPRPAGRLAWLHGASVGESLAVLPLIDALLAARDDLELLVTTGTVTSARLMAERLPARARHQFAPLDRPDAWRLFLDHWRPDLAVLVESELWPNLVAAVTGRGVPLALINGRMSARSYGRWRRVPAAGAALLRPLALCLAQSPLDAERLAALGAQGVRPVGNLKYAAAPLPADPAALAAFRTALGARPAWLAASTHPGEEAQLLAVHHRLAAALPALLTVIVPRHPERGAALAAWLQGEGVGFAQRSRGELPQPASAVYLADTLGELGLFYRLAGAAFIGGSLVPHGGQNPLEAARLGCPPLFGPHTDNFRDITALLEQQGAALRVADGDALAAALADLLRDPAAREAVAVRTRAAAAGQQEVLRATCEALLPLLDRARPAAAGADAGA